MLPWQWEQIVKPLYGWYRADGTRRYKEAGIWIPKKQGKSTLISALCLWHLMEYPGSQCYAIASNVRQAGIVYSEASSMLELGPLGKYVGKNKMLWVRRNCNTIEYKDKNKNRSTLQILPCSPEGVSGWNANYICFDEGAEWNATHAQTIWDRLKNATAARRNALKVVISTAQFDREHCFYHRYAYAKSVLSGEIEDITFLPVIYELTQEDDWQDIEVVKKANPSMGVTVPVQDYIDDLKTTTNNPREEARFRTLRCNTWVGHTEQWIATTAWQSCFEQYKESDLYGSDVYVGLDLAHRGDLASYCLLIPRQDKYYLLPRFFCPKDLASKKEKTDHVPYWLWSKQNHITLTDGDCIDYQVILDQMLKDAENFNFLEVRFDPYGSESLRQSLDEKGLYLVECKQSYPVMSPPTGFLERLILDKKVRHNNQPVLNWCLGNTAVRRNNNEEIMVDKRRSTGRIDGVVATILALGGVQANEGQWQTMLPQLL